MPYSTVLHITTEPCRTVHSVTVQYGTVYGSAHKLCLSSAVVFLLCFHHGHTYPIFLGHVLEHFHRFRHLRCRRVAQAASRKLPSDRAHAPTTGAWLPPERFESLAFEPQGLRNFNVAPVLDPFVQDAHKGPDRAHRAGSTARCRSRPQHPRSQREQLRWAMASFAANFVCRFALQSSCGKWSFRSGLPGGVWVPPRALNRRPRQTRPRIRGNSLRARGPLWHQLC